jgi:RNA polymerase sigma-70 factor (ECF subfamily)
VTDSRAAGHYAEVTAPASLEREPLAPRRTHVDEDAELTFDEVYEVYFDLVWRMLRRMGVAMPTIDDAVQDVFIVVHRRLESFERRSSIKTWLSGIALRVAHDHRRTLRRKGGHEALDPTLSDPADGPHEHLEKNRAVRELDAVLGELGEDKRAVFVLAELEEMTGPEMAEALGVPMNTVYSRLRAARRDFEAAVERRRGEGAWDR